MTNYIDPETNAPDFDAYAADLRSRFARKPNLNPEHRADLDPRPVVLYMMGTDERSTT